MVNKDLATFYSRILSPDSRIVQMREIGDIYKIIVKCVDPSADYDYYFHYDIGSERFVCLNCHPVMKTY